MMRSGGTLLLCLGLLVATARATVTVTVSPRTASVTFTQTQQFKATVSGSTNLAVQWSVNGILNGNSTVGTISSTGLYTPPHTWGGHTVTARSVADATKSASAPVVVTNYGAVNTFRYDNSRSGLNPSEIVLTTGNVNSAHFGKLPFSYGVDGVVNAQLLYVANVANMRPDGLTHNVIYVATENDSVYAFDADGRRTTYLWKTTFTNPAAGITTVACTDIDINDCSTPGWGITATPVIDTAHKTMFVVARTKESGKYVQRLHWLDITSGAEKLGGPVVIAASVQGTGEGTMNGTLNFDPLHENNRAALLLLNGMVYVAFGSLADTHPYHGWLLGYQPNYTANSLSLVSVLNTTPNGLAGALWNVGALAADTSGNIFCGTGNGTFAAGTSSHGNSWLRIATAGGALTVMDSFTPHNQASLDSFDLDVGSSGPLLLPFRTSSTQKMLLVAGSKQGTIYVLDRANLGGFNSSDQIVQSVTTGVFPQYTGLTYWNGRVYAAGNGPLQMFNISTSTGLLTFAQQTSHSFSFYENPVVSSNGTGSGIVWLVERFFTSSSTSIGILHAYDALNMSHELYNSSQVASRDAPNAMLRFQPPVVVNGKVYVAGRDLSDSQGRVVVYGLLP